jgi:membrane protein implicated in regulation of membrane protease activity
MAKLFKNNGLTIVLMLLFLGSILGQWIAGWQVQNEELTRHGKDAISLGAYAVDAEFISSVFENWESEFLQMSAYVVLTAMLVQKGSAESRDPDDPPRDEDLEAQARKDGAPRILKGGDIARWLYAHSLGIVLFTLFLLSFLLHWWNSAKSAAESALQHGETPHGALAYLGDPQLWFESFQNWQSEFLSTAVLVVLSIWLRQRESPESKPVAAPHSQTGSA